MENEFIYILKKWQENQILFKGKESKKGKKIENAIMEFQTYRIGKEKQQEHFAKQKATA